MGNWLKTGIGGTIGAGIGFFIGFNILRLKYNEEYRKGEECCNTFLNQFDCENQELCPFCRWGDGICHYDPPISIPNYLMYFGIPGAVIGGIVGAFIGSR